jgi:hypothetical protein
VTDLDAVGAPARRVAQEKIGIMNFAKTRRVRFFTGIRMDFQRQALISILYSLNVDASRHTENGIMIPFRHRKPSVKQTSGDVYFDLARLYRLDLRQHQFQLTVAHRGLDARAVDTLM